MNGASKSKIFQPHNWGGEFHVFGECSAKEEQDKTDTIYAAPDILKNSC